MKYFSLFLLFFFSMSMLVGCGEKVKETGEAVVEQITWVGTLKAKKEADKDIAIAKAKTIFTQQVIEGVDLTPGPCLSNNLIPDWVADVVHNPRTEIDNLPENQCSAYREGTAHHFVELDPSGNLIRAL